MGIPCFVVPPHPQGVYPQEWASVHPYNFSCLPHFLLTARGNKRSPQFMNSLFQYISWGTQNLCSQNTVLPYCPIKICVTTPPPTPSLPRSLTNCTSTLKQKKLVCISVLVCMCGHVPRPKEHVGCPALSFSVIFSSYRLSQ